MAITKNISGETESLLLSLFIVVVTNVRTTAGSAYNSGVTSAAPVLAPPLMDRQEVESQCQFS